MQTDDTTNSGETSFGSNGLLDSSGDFASSVLDDINSADKPNADTSKNNTETGSQDSSTTDDTVAPEDGKQPEPQKADKSKKSEKDYNKLDGFARNVLGENKKLESALANSEAEKATMKTQLEEMDRKIAKLDALAKNTSDRGLRNDIDSDIDDAETFKKEIQDRIEQQQKFIDEFKKEKEEGAYKARYTEASETIEKMANTPEHYPLFNEHLDKIQELVSEGYDLETAYNKAVPRDVQVAEMNKAASEKARVEVRKDTAKKNSVTSAFPNQNSQGVKADVQQEGDVFDRALNPVRSGMLF